MSESQRISKVYVVSHTHWDREWYQDFQGFRTRLVYMLDELLDTLASNPDYRYFLMDGQTIVVDDYLEIRPERREQLLGFIREGRIAVGPWYVMPDEFLVSGESLVRNLQRGFRDSRSLGAEPAKAGYVPDIFGHNSQLPQLLRGFGIDNAILFRGFHGDADPAEIRWEGADGSTVLGLKLDEDRAYGDFYFFIRWPFADRNFQYDNDEIIRRAQDMLTYKNERATTDIMLGLDGVDHIEIEPLLPELLRLLNGASELEGVEFVHASLEHYLEALRGKTGELRLYRGEQKSPGYSGLNNMVLVNVLSSRIHLKQMNQQCEVLLEKWAEPWAVFASLEGRAYPHAFLDRAWTYLMQNHPHDSICGCSISQVHQDMIYRFDQSRLIAERMMHEQALYFANHIDPAPMNGSDVLVVYNAVQEAVNGVIVAEAELQRPEHGLFLELRDADGQPLDIQLIDRKPNTAKRVHRYRDIPGAETVERVKFAFQGRVPSFGYRGYALQFKAIAPLGSGEYGRKEHVHPKRVTGTMKQDETTWDNGLLILHIRENGTIQVTDRTTGASFDRLLAFEDEADIGEGWNHIAPLVNETFYSSGCRAEISTVTDGPFVGVARVELVFLVPEAIAPDELRRKRDKTPLRIVTDIELRLNDPVLRCRTSVHNTARAHRLKLLLPTGRQTGHYHASTPYDVVKREIVQPDYAAYSELNRGNEPYNGFVALEDEEAGIALYAKGLYELAIKPDAARTVALTLFRSTGKEVFVDGPQDGGQLLRQLDFDYAIRPFAAGQPLPALWGEREQFAAGLRTASVRRDEIRYENLQMRGRDLPAEHAFVQVDGENVRVTAILRAQRETDAFVIRLLNLGEEEASAVIRFDRPLASSAAVTLDEQPLVDFDGLQGGETGFSLKLGAKAIQTVLVKFRG
ncbi:glycoside hydrolase family 38 C-terminal domain-containing protein [Paenibacillus sacheonensis]|uniref:Glycoside hydrolase family 38 central domain-containing protein n=1 Tax=Paenibacillus sacheonensis TaxID=742054 RepID=A0A7X4YNM3_9BACL|nr:glycoside hydrolase family 38 C-terminal domain-containing protein [Paenibacillus sacheonensis]MBM7565377.1 alpha-mannosidase/mannosylglycerate hydrolase [Paenibacillus sacheonensis]NBC69695.1 hypothetical protein [Paenibacillus sacheonensis]